MTPTTRRVVLLVVGVTLYAALQIARDLVPQRWLKLLLALGSGVVLALVLVLAARRQR